MVDFAWGGGGCDGLVEELILDARDKLTGGER